MTLDEADVLLAQWADWQADELRKLEYRASKWQFEYQPGFAEEASSTELPSGEDQVMVDVDAALAMLKLLTPHHFRVLQGRYVQRHNFTYLQLDSAKRAFIAEYQSPVDIDLENYLSFTAGRSHV